MVITSPLFRTGIAGFGIKSVDANCNVLSSTFFLYAPPEEMYDFFSQKVPFTFTSVMAFTYPAAFLNLRIQSFPKDSFAISSWLNTIFPASAGAASLKVAETVTLEAGMVKV